MSEDRADDRAASASPNCPVNYIMTKWTQWCTAQANALAYGGFAVSLQLP